MSLNIRQATTQDVFLITELFRNTVTSINRQDYTKEETQVWAESAHNIARWEQKIATQYFLVAEINAQIVGFASINQAGNYLDFLYVHHRFQRQSIAQKLYNTLVQRELNS
ncbi:GNAT family N-acetyltransferase [Microscilla marina]|uniref:N-acetyltransferase domain-containing protein n=1 Tax=Microscilla marina ATCC 23134 TaxID=313606 RepID=A1ZWJ8_MICM2|nr:GNAT family N-acetyltransferase [Microscilla marina]EAY25238.1 conserved hypothetical protein [Microscilla marina ATCC 23134]